MPHMGSERGSNEDRTAGDATGRRRYTVPEAALALGISPEAVRTRISRGKLDHEKDGRRVFVLLEPDQTRPNADQTSDQSQSEPSVLISEVLRERIEDLRQQLEHERQAHAEARRMLAAALERIPPAIEAPSEERESTVSGGPVPTDAGGEPQSASERPQERRSLWQRLFGG